MISARSLLIGAATLTALTTSAGCQRTALSESAPTGRELTGVWSLTAVGPSSVEPLIDPSQPGLYIFADGYYSVLSTWGANPRVKSLVSFEPTQEEIISQHQTIIANSGTYEVDGAVVTLHPIRPSVRLLFPTPRRIRHSGLRASG